MKRSSGGGASCQNVSDGRKRAEQPQSDGESGCFSFDPTDSQNGENDPKQRRELRSRYRELINTVQGEYQDRLSLRTKGCCSSSCWLSFSENREDMLSPSSNKLTEVLKVANELFKDGKCCRIYSWEQARLTLQARTLTKLNKIILLTNIYLENPSFPSIHFLYLFYGSQGSAGACPNFQGVRGGYTPDRSPAHCRANTQRLTTFTLTPMVSLDWSVHLSRILDCGRKLEWPGNTHSCTKRTCKLLTQNIWSYMLFLSHTIWKTKKITCFFSHHAVLTELWLFICSSTGERSSYGCSTPCRGHRPGKGESHPDVCRQWFWSERLCRTPSKWKYCLLIIS